MLENLLNDLRIFDAGNHFDVTAAVFADFNINIEDSLEALHPGHGAVALCRTASLVAMGFSVGSEMAGMRSILVIYSFLHGLGILLNFAAQVRLCSVAIETSFFSANQFRRSVKTAEDFYRSTA